MSRTSESDAGGGAARHLAGAQNPERIADGHERGTHRSAGDTRAGQPTLLRRLTLVIEDDAIDHVFYPVIPPDKSSRSEATKRSPSCETHERTTAISSTSSPTAITRRSTSE